MVSMNKYDLLLRESRAFQSNISRAGISFLCSEFDDVDESLEDSCARLARNLQKFKPKETPAGLKLPVHPDIYEAFAKSLSEVYGLNVIRGDLLAFHMGAIAARLQNIDALSEKDFQKAYDFVNVFDNYVVNKEF